MRDIPNWSEAAQTLTPGKYRHFKGNEYQVLSVARHSETLEELVVYESSAHPGRFWVRSLAVFVGNVSRDGYEGPRFTRVS